MPGRNVYRLKAFSIAVSKFFASESSMQKTKGNSEFAEEANKYRPFATSLPLALLRSSG